MRGSWKLTLPAESSSGKRGYTATATPETWADIKPAAARAREAFTRALADLTAGAVSACPHHVQIVCRELRSRTAMQTFLVSDELAPGATWVYFVDIVETERTVYCNGGMPSRTFTALRRMRGQRRVALATLDVSKLYDQVDMQREASIPETPNAYSSPQSSLSASFGMAREQPPGAAAAAAIRVVESSPLDDYGPSMPDFFRHAMAHVTAHAPLEDLLMQRFEQMKNVAMYVRKNSGMAPHSTAATGGSLAQMNEVATIAALLDLESADATLIHAADVVAHWMVRLLVLPATQGFVHTWFAEQETRLVLLHLRLACTNAAPAAEFRALLGPCTARYRISQVDAAEYGMTRTSTLRAGISVIHTKRGSDGLLLVNATHIADHLLPRYIRANVDDIYHEAAAVDEAQIIDDASAGLLVDDTCDATYNDDDGDTPGALFHQASTRVREVVGRIVAERQRDHESSQKDSFMPRSGVDPDTLPDLYEEAFWRHATPLCQQRLYTKLRDTGHLKHGEIFNLSWYLRDLSYSDNAVNDFFKKHMTGSAGRLTDQEFLREYRSVGRRNEKSDDWEDGVRKRPYTQGCVKQVAGIGLVSDADPTNQGMCIGCPFERLDDTNLRGALAKLGGTDLTDIEDIVSRRNTSGARVGCAAHFAAGFGGPPDANWLPPAQRVWTHRAIEALVPYL